MAVESRGDRCESEPSLRLDPARFPRRIDLDLRPELLERLQQIATASGRSLSEVITDLLSRSLCPWDEPPT